MAEQKQPTQPTAPKKFPIRITRTCVQPGRMFEKDQVVDDLPEDAAKSLVAMGNAESIEAQPAAAEPAAHEQPAAQGEQAAAQS
jgi:hypothetical protein